MIKKTIFNIDFEDLSKPNGLNKKEFINIYFSFCKKENLNIKDVAVGYGGACLLYGIRKVTNDLDLDVPIEIYNKILKQGFVEKDSTVGMMFNYNDLISLHPGIYNKKIKMKDVTTIVDGVCCYTLEYLLETKQNLANHPNRKPHKLPQDLLDIKAIKAKLE